VPAFRGVFTLHLTKIQALSPKNMLWGDPLPNTKKLLKIVNYTTIKETKKLKETMVGEIQMQYDSVRGMA